MRNIIMHVPTIAGAIMLAAVGWLTPTRTMSNTVLAIGMIVVYAGLVWAYEWRIARLKRRIRRLKPYKDRHDGDNAMMP